jgi:hypothetical protein
VKEVKTLPFALTPGEETDIDVDFRVVRAELYPLSPMLMQGRADEFLRELDELDRRGRELAPLGVWFDGTGMCFDEYKEVLEDVVHAAERVVAVVEPGDASWRALELLRSRARQRQCVTNEVDFVRSAGTQRIVRDIAIVMGHIADSADRAQFGRETHAR